MSISVNNISKFYGEQCALNNINFDLHKGEIVGFLGPNGAGKSTLMKIIVGYLNPTEGKVSVGGHDLSTHKIEAQKEIGYLPENNPLYLEMYVREYMNFHASIHKMNKNDVEEVIEKTGLHPEAHKKIKELSKGYRQRVGLAAALLHNPDVLILDEPTTGLDPNQLVEIRALIKEVGKNKTVLLSTHIMQEVEAMCSRVLLIDKGSIIADKQLEELVRGKQQCIEVEFDYRIEKELVLRIPNLKSASNLHGNIWELIFETKKDMRSEVYDFAKNNGLKTLQIIAKSKDLEQLFQELTAN